MVFTSCLEFMSEEISPDEPSHPFDFQELRGEGPLRRIVCDQEYGHLGCIWGLCGIREPLETI